MFSSICIEVFTPLSLRHRHRILRHCHRRRLLRLLRRRLPDSAPPPSRAAAMGQEPPQCPCPCGGTGLITLLDPAADGRRWSLCSCRSCGPVGNDGSRRCTILVDPIVMFWTGGLILCEDCWEYCSLKRRIEAVKRARKKRKMQDRGSETEDRGRGSDHSTLLPQNSAFSSTPSGKLGNFLRT